MRDPLKCPCCDGPLTKQPTTGKEHYQFLCYGLYKKRDGKLASRIKCEYKRVECNDSIVYEYVKEKYFDNSAVR